MKQKITSTLLQQVVKGEEMITLDVHKKEGFKLTWPFIQDPVRRYAYINKVKESAGFSFNKPAGGWISEGPEVILDMDRSEIWPYITTITPEAAQRVAKFRLELDAVLDAKHADIEGAWGYQQVGTNALTMQKRGLLADDMGLGKSKQALDAVAKLRLNRVLVVAPKTLTWNWKAEIEKWYPSWNAVVMGDTKADREAAWSHFAVLGEQPTIMIVNYEKLRLADWNYTAKWDVVIFDEAHKLKNTSTQTWKAAKKLKTEYLWMLTGTPLEIRIEELFGIMSLLRPSLFGGWLRFRDQHLITDAWGNVLGPRNLEILKERIAPWMTRRKKEDVLKYLPPKLYNTLYIELSADEKRQYEKIKREFLTWLAEHDRDMSEANALTQLLRLQQFTSSPDLLKAEGEEEEQGSKYAALLETIQEYEGRIMVFTRFSQMAIALLNWLCEDIKAHPEAIITGDISSGEERVSRVKAFNEAKLGKVFISTDAGAYGLNVTGADLIIHYDQLWNPGKMWQREDRLHRIGQTNVVNVLNLVCSNTVDEGMLKILEKRRDIFTDIIDGAEDKAIGKLGSAAIRKIVEGKL